MSDIVSSMWVGYVLGVASMLVFFVPALRLLRKDKSNEVAPTPITIDWQSIGPGVIAAVAHARVNANVVVSWDIIHAVIEREGYMLIAKPAGAEPVARHQ